MRWADTYSATKRDARHPSDRKSNRPADRDGLTHVDPGSRA